MSLSMSSASLPVCTRMLTNLSHILSKAEQFVEAKKKSTLPRSPPIALHPICFPSPVRC